MNSPPDAGSGLMEASRKKAFLVRAGWAIVLWFVCGLLASFAVCQEQGADPASTPSNSKNSYTISGTVVNALTGEPLRRAMVEVTGQTPRMALTDFSGHFEFAGILEERAYLTASKPGFLAGQGGVADPNLIAVSRDSSNVVIKLSPANVIFGRLTTADQQPLEGFVVSTVTRQVVEGRLTWTRTAGGGMTDEAGNFRISGLPSGTFYLIVNQNQATTLSRSGVVNAREQGYASTYYPGVAQSGAATPIELAYGREVEANMVLSAEPLYQVAGSIGGDPNVISGLTMTRNAGEESDYFASLPVSGGRFEAKLPAGSYSVEVPRSDGVQQSGSVTINSDNADLQLSLVNAPAVEVHLQTEHSGGAVLQPASASSSAVPGVIVQLFSTSPFRPWSGFWTPGYDQIRNMRAGAFRARINTTAPWWVKSARSGGVDLLTDDLTVPASGTVSPIEITLRDDAGNVRGTVTPADRSQIAIVLLVQSRGERNLIQSMGSLDGNFIFSAVAPGDYAVVAFRGTDQIEYENPAVLDAYLSNAPHATVQANGTASVSVSVSAVKR